MAWDNGLSTSLVYLGALLLNEKAGLVDIPQLAPKHNVRLQKNVLPTGQTTTVATIGEPLTMQITFSLLDKSLLQDLDDLMATNLSFDIEIADRVTGQIEHRWADCNIAGPPTPTVANDGTGTSYTLDLNIGGDNEAFFRSLRS
ncbi:MAG: hypothetical protein FWE37_02695 [Spirochaetaceae bacterium]|nr:hypothetical protein [Spirochaetaceae bacterium]